MQKAREKRRDGDMVERQMRLRMVAYSFIISRSFRLPLNPADRSPTPLLRKQEREGVGIKDRGRGGKQNGRWGQVKEGGVGQGKEEEKQGGDDDDGKWCVTMSTATAGEEWCTEDWQ